MGKILIIGFDGATWDLLNKMIRKGFMPTLGSLINKGVHGELESTIPPVTGPAWSTFSTGKNPGKHGIFDFIKVQDSLTDIKTMSSKDLKEITFYEILNNYGLSNILINLPGSYPPKTDDIIITSFLTKGNSFILDIIEGKKIFLIGNKNEL
jgi:predicted AlkP superfamily phosphohydrolase/phosphomutase